MHVIYINVVIAIFCKNKNLLLIHNMAHDDNISSTTVIVTLDIWSTVNGKCR